MREGARRSLAALLRSAHVPCSRAAAPSLCQPSTHHPGRPPGDLSDVLRLDVKTPVTPGGAAQYLAFKDFESGSALDSALALVEHLMDGG